MYQDTLMGKNEICQKCKSTSESKGRPLINGPLPIYHVGKNFDKIEKRLLLVGALAYGWDKEIKEAESLKSSEEDRFIKYHEVLHKRFREIWNNEESRYFKIIKKCCDRIFGNEENAFNNIAITNLVRCNTGSIRDLNFQNSRWSCISLNQNGFLAKEIEILKPTHVAIFSTQNKYTKTFKDYYEKYPKEVVEIWEFEHPSYAGFDKTLVNLMELYNT
jgi:hypothetical protein